MSSMTCSDSPMKPMTTTTQPVRNGDRIQIHYTSKSLEGSIIETSVGREPFEFVVGSRDVITGLSQGVLGLRTGDSHSLAIPADQAFGKHNPDLLKTVPSGVVGHKVAVGDQLTAEVDGVQLDVWVQKVYADEILLDGNHPLAGETLLVDVSILRVEAGNSSNPHN